MNIRKMNVKQILHLMMNVELDHPSGAYCDRRIIAMGFMDNSWHNNASGSVVKEINNVECEIFCPNVRPGQQIFSHEDFTFYSIDMGGKWERDLFSAEEVIKYIKSAEAKSK